MINYRVLLNHVLVGYIAQDGSDRVTFRFTDEYRKLVNRPVLSQYFEDDLERTYSGKRGALPAFFANLVPEGALRALLERSFDVREGDDLALLHYVGRDLPGAVEIAPTEDVLEDTEHRRLDDAIETEAEEYSSAISHALRFSLAGVQMKFSVLREQEKITLTAHGQLGDWIVKLDSNRFPNLVENEFATLEWARASGFQVPDCQVLPSEMLPAELFTTAPTGSNVLLIRRYDRTESGRVHQEDFAQVVGLPPSRKYDQLKYEQLAMLVRMICGEEGYMEFIRRLTFMVASGNLDAHLKNWSFYYPDGVSAQLTPMYDQVVTIAWPDQLTMEWSLKFASTKALFGIDADAFKRLAQRAGGDVRETLRAVDDVLQQIVTGWRDVELSSLLPNQHLQHLQDYWRRAPLLRPHAGAVAEGHK